MTPEQFDAVARVLPEALLLVTGEGRLLSANPAAAAMLDLPAEGPCGRLLSDLVSDPAEKVAQYLGACARSRQLVLGSLSWRKRDGAGPAYRAEGAVVRPWSPAEPALILLRLKPKETTSSRFILLNEKIEELSSEIHRRQQAEEELHTLNATLEERIEERTDALSRANDRLREREGLLQQANQALERRNRELQDFAHVASHDLQEPLRKIRTFADFLATEYGGALEEEAQHYLQRIRDAASRMSTLISDLLAFSRVATQTQPFDEVDLNNIVAGVLSDLEARIADTGGCVEVGPLPTLEADPLQMRQLFQNLIGNALKFHRPDVPPAVQVSGRVEDRGGQEICRLEVEDNGIGIEEKHLDRIFKPFQRLHSQTEYEGTGIGLAICRRIAERHGGSLRAHSTPGAGSRFVVTLPVRHEQSSAAA